VVLLRPEVAGNVGAVARLMKNFELNDLVLVVPKADPWCAEARQRATHGEPILESARIVAGIDQALAGCVASVAFSSLAGGVVRRGMAGPPQTVMAELLSLTPAGPIAFVFGPEPSGLSTAEVSRCDRLISIPASPEYPSLNLSHAVAIALAEVYRLSATHPPADVEPLAPDEDRERMHLRKALEDVHFLWDEKADLLFHGLRQLIIRARPTENDVKLLHGLARQLEWVVRNNYTIGD
jgi:TrmH family RNA methyltransferase